MVWFCSGSSGERHGCDCTYNTRNYSGPTLIESTDLNATKGCDLIKSIYREWQKILFENKIFKMLFILKNLFNSHKCIIHGENHLKILAKRFDGKIYWNVDYQCKNEQWFSENSKKYLGLAAPKGLSNAPTSMARQRIDQLKS